ncbi:MAG: hypothetical protein AB7G28_24475 [Pirellulales bacterium]
MVTCPAANWCLFAASSATESAEPLIERLDPPRRAAVLMAILGLVLLGLALVACVMIGGRWMRRVARHQLGPTQNTSHIENRRLREALEPILPQGEAGETAVARRRSDDTVADA